MRFSGSTHLQMCLSLETSTCIIRTGLPILVELIDLVNSVIISLSQMTLLRWLTFLLGSQTVIFTVPFWIYIFFLTLIFVLQGLSLYWKILVMLLSQFPLTFHHIHSGMPRFIDCIAYDYSPADWGGVCYHLRDVLWGDTFKLSAAATVRMDWTLITLFLLMWKWMGLFLRKNHLLRCWGWPSLLNWIGALTLSLLPKLLPRKLELNSFYEVSFS